MLSTLRRWPTGLAGLAVGHPFDTVKVRLQSRELSTRYKGTWNCLATIVRQEKVLGLYKGMASPAMRSSHLEFTIQVGVAVINAMVFGVYGYFMEMQLNNSGRTDPTLCHIFLAGTGSGVVNSFITCPMELVKVRLQNQGIPSVSSTHYRGPLDCTLKTYQAGGMRSIYKGMIATVLREASFGPYFVSYELFRRSLRPPGKSVDELDGGRLVLAGGAAGIVAWCSTYAAGE
ncbi:mitochondrial carrier domain-containing protein, partial [Jimgerdemannia flammicorona]